MDAKDVRVGVGSYIHPSAVIRGLSGPANSIHIGDHTYIGENVQIICDDFSIGDYGKIHHDTNIHGYRPCQIGHNAWVGQYTIIDCIGGTTIGDNCGIGAHSQLWSHIKYGDTLAGNRFNSSSPLTVGKDVWFVGHCIVSPITAHDRSMAMAGSVVTKDMQPNSVYAGVPAQNITDKVGPQFSATNIDEQMDLMRGYLDDCGAQGVRIVESTDEFRDDGNTYFALRTRQYTKRNTADEVTFMKYLLPEKAKFTPC